MMIKRAKMVRHFSTDQTKNIEDLILNYQSVKTPLDRFKLFVQAASGAIQDPKRADLVSAVGDLTSS